MFAATETETEHEWKKGKQRQTILRWTQTPIAHYRPIFDVFGGAKLQLVVGFLSPVDLTVSFSLCTARKSCRLFPEARMNISLQLTSIVRKR